MPHRWNCALLLALMLLGCQPHAPLGEGPAKIPLLPTKDPAFWPADAFQVEVLTPLPASQAPKPSRLALAWEPDGLRLWAEVRDPVPVEGADNELWKGDSIELFITSPHGSNNWIQLICTPGRTLENTKPRWIYVDRQKNRAGPLSDPVIQMTPLDNSYLLSILFPWNNMVQPPREGDTIGLQVYINDASFAEGKNRLLWFPSADNQGNPKNYHPVQLAREAGRPHKIAATLEIEKLNNIVLKISASPDLSGRAVEIRSSPDDAWITLGHLSPARDGLSLASLPLPPFLLPAAGEIIEVRAGGLPVAPLTIPDLSASRLWVLRNSELLAKPSVFSNSALPAIQFKNKELIDAAFGPCTVKVRYFNAAYEEVQIADKPGRYGALVEIQTADGLTDKRRLTLFRSAKSVLPKQHKFQAALDFPPEFGLPPDITKREAQAVANYLNNFLHAQAGSNVDWAALLAGLDDAGKQPSKWHGFDFGRMNFEWWCGLEKSQGLLQPYKYLVTLPSGYDSDPEKKWPLLLFLHGAGERGTDLNLVKKNGPPMLIEAGKTFPFIVVSPQCPEGEGWSALKVNDFVDQISTKYRVDPARIVVTGLSMGGGGSLYLAASFPGKYAAIAPICGNVLSDMAPRLKDTAIWAFNGQNDTEALPAQIESLVLAINQKGGKARLTLYPGVGHDCWVQAYQDPALYEWFLQQRR